MLLQGGQRQRLGMPLLILTFALLAGCDALPISIRISFASPTLTATATPIPAPTHTATSTTIPSPTSTPIPSPTGATSCGARIEIFDSSVEADLIWERVIPYLQELEICDAQATIEIIDGENVGLEITGGGEPAGAYTWCYPQGDIGERTETIIAVGLPEWDRWDTYVQGWTVVGVGIYPSAAFLHELYHVYQCLVSGEVVGEGNWTVDPDEYAADNYALSRLGIIQTEPIIVFVD